MCEKIEIRKFAKTTPILNPPRHSSIRPSAPIFKATVQSNPFHSILHIAHTPNHCAVNRNLLYQARQHCEDRYWVLSSTRVGALPLPTYHTRWMLQPTEAWTMNPLDRTTSTAAGTFKGCCLPAVWCIQGAT